MLFLLASIAFIGLILINIIQILSRYVISYSIAGNQEISLFLVSWAIFLGFGKVVKKNEDISITFLIDKLPIGLDKAANLLLILLYLIASGWIFKTTYTYMVVQSGMSSKILDIPNFLFTLPLFILMIYVFIHFLVQLITSPTKLEELEEIEEKGEEN